MKKLIINIITMLLCFVILFNTENIIVSIFAISGIICASILFTHIIKYNE